ncbi:MAG: deoxyribose-phosphate aldolase [Bacillota bacterium]|nr:deoxyribose-phosphate aldolase [Bacillota bacterium]
MSDDLHLSPQEKEAILRSIDHTFLRPEGGPAEIDRLCDEALAHRFGAVCVQPLWVARAARRLRGTGVRVASVVGFPHGAQTAEVKAAEARRAVADGADELDMVIAFGALRAGLDDLVEEEIRAVVAAGVPVKCILETGALSDEEVDRGCDLAARAGARFVKTSTGFGPGGATPEAVRRMRARVGGRLGVKAAGGIRTLADLLLLREAGADRFGTSHGVAIARELEEAAR